MKPTRFPQIIIICLLTTAIIFACVVPLFYGGSTPIEKLQRFDDGGKSTKALLDCCAYAINKKSAVFDITVNGKEGIWIYRLEEEKNVIETYCRYGDASDSTASYMLIKDGVRYSFAMDANGWYFVDKRVFLTDLNRLAKNLALILADRKADTNALMTDLNGLTGFDLSDVLNAELLPTAIRSLFRNFDDEVFKTVSGYSFNRNAMELQYSFSPPDSKAFADKVNSHIQIAYTNKMRNIMNIVGITEGIASLFGYDLFEGLFDMSASFSIHAITGKLTAFTYECNSFAITAENRDYGNCKIDIESEQLQTLIAQYVV